MSNLEIDHLFCFCSSELKEATLAVKVGFKLNNGIRHERQGTANRCIIFNENYFEFIFMDSLEDAQKNPLRLDRRANWQATQCSPFGIALRGILSEEDRRQFWEYHPPYFPTKTILIHKSSETNPEWPLLFVMPTPENMSLEMMRPANSTRIEPSLLKHENGANKIEKVEVSGPNYQWPLAQAIKQILLINSNSPKMNIHVNTKIPLQLELNKVLKIESCPL